MYKQMSLKDALVVYPVLRCTLPDELFRDDEYLVRVHADGSRIKFEIGLAGDEWEVK